MNATALANTILTAVEERDGGGEFAINLDRKSTRLNSSHYS